MEFVRNYLTMDIAIFVLLQIINVILSTVRSILTVSGSKMTASLMSSVSYTVGAVITKLLTQQAFEVVVVVTFFTNLVGVYAAKLILEKTKKERLWTITATLRGEQKDGMEKDLLNRGVKFTLCPALNDRFLINIFSYSRGESAIVKEILQKYNTKFTITENFLF